MQSHLVNTFPKFPITNHNKWFFSWLFEHLTKDFIHGVHELHCYLLLHFASASASAPAFSQSSLAYDEAGKVAQKHPVA